ncbi:MAG: T9SS type A sorting domain-containing protein [Prevotella sp.]|nr:T9SS type A sorting domain-containing protein [Prevotella sp.]
MKKLYLCISFVCFSLGSTAQVKTDGKLDMGNPSRLSLSIPKEFCYNNAPMIQMYDNENASSQDRNLLIYDENLKLKETLKIGGNRTFDYQITYQDEVRDVESVTIKQETEDNLNLSYEDFVAREKMVNPSFDESKLTITEEVNGDKLIVYDYASDSYYSYYLDQFYYGYSTFGAKYPRVYFRCKKDVMYQYRATYSVSYGEWKVSGTRTVDEHYTYNRLYLCNINLNQGDGQANYYFEASQTLFNNDEAFEYIVPKYVLSSSGESESSQEVVPDDYIITNRTITISEKSHVVLAGFQVMSSNGTVIRDLNFDPDFIGSGTPNKVYVITIGSKTYLAFSGYQDGKNYTAFYEVNRQTSEIRKASMARGSFIVSPTIADKSTPINITFGDDNSKGSDIIVYSTTGNQMQQQSVPAGEKNTQLTVNRNPGMYIVARKQIGKAVETQKIIIK